MNPGVHQPRLFQSLPHLIHRLNQGQQHQCQVITPLTNTVQQLVLTTPRQIALMAKTRLPIKTVLRLSSLQWT